MEALSRPEITRLEKIRPTQLKTLLDHFTSIKILSLDCFDTLLWRQTAAPIDVFYELQHCPTFKAMGFTPLMRARAEARARMLQFLRHISTEIRLQDIYRAAFPELAAETLTALENEEVMMEMSVCYAFPGIVDLMRAAKLKGIKIIIVSDTYFQKKQLEILLKNALPSDVFDAIDQIFCSNEFGVSKVNGLFKKVIDEMQIPAEAILHIGDNHSADFVAARNKAIHALHFIHHEENIAELFRMQSTSASMMDSSIRHTRSLKTPFRALLASHEFPPQKSEEFIGYAALGPILFAFSQFLLREIASLKQQGKKPKILFLMRDAHLPALVCEAITEERLGERIRISRFASYAASFRHPDDINRYLGEMVTSNRFADMTKQLLLPQAIAEPLIQQTLKASEPLFEFIQLIHRDDIMQLIFKESAAYRKRLLLHIQKTLSVEPHDTLVFVDLGYSGTTQNLLEPILRDELQVDVTGRYLISLSVPHWQSSRKGLMDPHSCDERALLGLVSYIALFEQLCTCNENSVIDYDASGEPLFSQSSISQQQHRNLDLIQNHCVQFARDAKTFFANTHLNDEILRDTVLTGLTRLLFLPTRTEISYLESFEFDLNLGTQDTFKIFNQEQGLTGLKRRGLFSIFMEKNSKTFRTNAPAELRAAGIELALSLMGQYRFCLEFGFNDISLRKESLNIILQRGSEVAHSTLDATLTHDGYFALCLPVALKEAQIGISFGQKYQWIQFESAEMIPAQTFLSFRETQYAENCWSNLIFEQMNHRGEKLFECLSEKSLVIVKPTPNQVTKNMIFRIVFRPIVARGLQEIVS